MPPQKALVDDFEDDIFINYAHADNESLMEDFKGFVDRVHERLAVRLKQLVGEEPKIWRDVLLEGTQQLTETLVVRLSRTAFLVCILSPSYVKSTWCRRELHEFYQFASKNKGIKINNRSRIFKVVKTPIGNDPRADPLEGSDLPDELRTVLQESLGYDFYEVDKLSGKIREFNGEFGAEYEKKHLAMLEDLAQDIMRFINDQGLQKSIDKCVYLAETTPELNDERNEIRRNLLQHDYHVLPDENLPPESAAFDEKVSNYLKSCILSIHLVGSDFTAINAAQEKVQDFDVQHQFFAARVRKQHELAMSRGENDSDFSRLVWMPPGLTPREESNQEFLTYLRNDPAVQENAEILGGSKLEDLKTTIQKRLKISWEEGSGKAQGKRVYLICDKQDKDAVVPLKDFLQQQSYEVLLPFSDGNQVLRTHTENLRLCDAVLVFYGSSNTMTYKVAELRKISVLRDNKPLLAKGIYVAGPETDHKKTFTTDQAVIMKCFGDFSPDSIKPFLDQFEKSTAAAV